MEKFPATSQVEANLARRVNVAFRESRRAFRRSIEQAIECGKLLIEAKELVRHGNWIIWLEVNTEVSPRTAQKLIRLARNQDAIMANAPDRAHLAINSALELIAQKKPGAMARKDDAGAADRPTSLRRRRSTDLTDSGAVAALQHDLDAAHSLGEAARLLRAITQIYQTDLSPRHAAAEIRRRLQLGSGRVGETNLSVQNVSETVDADVAWLQDLSGHLRQPERAKLALFVVPREGE